MGFPWDHPVPLSFDDLTVKILLSNLARDFRKYFVKYFDDGRIVKLKCIYDDSLEVVVDRKMNTVTYGDRTEDIDTVAADLMLGYATGECAGLLPRVVVHRSGE